MWGRKGGGNRRGEEAERTKGEREEMIERTRGGEGKVADRERKRGE